MADALRAQAAGTGSLPTPAPRAARPAPRAARPALGPGWVLLLAVLLGLAAGTVVAVITLR